MRVEMKASEVLLKAADAIRERGHAKHMLVDLDTGGMCLSGAISFAISDNPEAGAVPTAADRMGDVAAVLGLEGGWWDAAAWNNEDSRRPSEVIAALDAAAVVALQEEGIEPEDVF